MLLATVCLIAVLLLNVKSPLSKVKTTNSQLPASTPAFDSAKYVAMVNGQPIERSYYKEQQDSLSHFQKWLKDNKTDSNSLPTDLIQTLIEDELAHQFVEKNNLEPTQLEIDKHYSNAVASVGSEYLYLKKMKTIQDIGKEEILAKMKLEILKTKIEKFTKKPFAVWVKEFEKKSIIEKADK